MKTNIYICLFILLSLLRVLQEEDNEDFDEMAENCFSGVESFISTCPVRDITPFLSSILEVGLPYLLIRFPTYHDVFITGGSHVPVV